VTGERPRDVPCDLILRGKNPALLVFVRKGRPETRAVAAVDELHRNAQPFAIAAQAAFQQVGDAEFPCDRPKVLIPCP
jgi:hypothetical protein